MITWEGNWTEANEREARKGLEYAFRALFEMYIADAFQHLFGDITLEAVKSAGRYWARVDAWDTHKMLFSIGRVTDKLVIHELGHLINDNLPEHESPAHLLSVHGIKTPDGKLVTGSGASGYARNAGRYAPRNGYKADRYPVPPAPAKLGERQHLCRRLGGYVAELGHG